MLQFCLVKFCLIERNFCVYVCINVLVWACQFSKVPPLVFSCGVCWSCKLEAEVLADERSCFGSTGNQHPTSPVAYNLVFVYLIDI